MKEKNRKKDSLPLVCFDLFSSTLAVISVFDFFGGRKGGGKKGNNKNLGKEEYHKGKIKYRPMKTEKRRKYETD